MNMHTMLQADNAMTAEEENYAAWLRDVCAILKCPPIEEGSDADDTAFDLYEAGATPTEAAAELSI